SANIGPNEREFAGEGSSTQSNSLTGRIGVTVVEVMSNGNMKVRGEKLLHLNQGDEFIRISGIVRQVDVRSDNTIPSTLVANAQISYGGNGALAEANSQGWLSRFFSSSWWPF
ncbi:MAG: flagellar basal body L-ring protein FlgH, partial [Thioalkalispiraceae bacterium]